MANVTGPISTLPGSLHNLPEGQMCDEHPDRPAVRRVQGETDSFGSEQHDMCQDCWQAYKRHVPEKARCDYCNKEDVLRPIRDYDEGSCGPVYYVCQDCRTRVNEALAREAAEYYANSDDIFDDDSFEDE